MEKSFRMWERQLLQPPCSCSSVVAPESAQTQSGWQNSKMFFPNLFKIFHMLGGKPDYLLGPGPGSSSSELGNWRTAFVARSYTFWCPGSITKQATGTLKKKNLLFTHCWKESFWIFVSSQWHLWWGWVIGKEIWIGLETFQPCGICKHCTESMSKQNLQRNSPLWN